MLDHVEGIDHFGAFERALHQKHIICVVIDQQYRPISCHWLLP